jgi:hypothetical protein
MRCSHAIVLLARTGSSASAGSQIVLAFMSRYTHVSSPVIRSRKWHLFCACRTSRSRRAPSNRFALKSSSKNEKNQMKCRLFMLREVVIWRCTDDAGILRNSAIVRTEDHDSASKICRIRASISSREGRPGLDRSLRSERWNSISWNQYFTLLSSYASSW